MKEYRPAWQLPGHKTLAAAVVLACSAAAQAGTGTVTVTSFSATASAGTISWLDPFQSFQAVVLNGGGLLGSNSDSFDANDYGFLAVGASTTGAVAGVSTTTPQTFTASAATTTTNGPAFTPRNQANAFASQSGEFKLSQAGTVTFTVGYTLGAASAGGNASDNFSTSSLHFNAANSDGTSSGDRTANLLSFQQASNVGSQSGTWTVNVALKAGESGYYTLDGTAVAFNPVVVAVPEPATWASMAGGLLALSALARRRLPRARA